VPALPDAYLAAVDAIGMGVQDVLWLRFEQRYWSTDASVWAVLDESATYRTWLNLEPSTGFPILVAITGGDAAAETEKLSDADARNAALGSIVGYFDLLPATSSPTPTPSG
jgi:monoamine oxidase